MVDSSAKATTTTTTTSGKARNKTKNNKNNKNKNKDSNNNNNKPTATTKGKEVICDRCDKPFPSKNALFRHLKATIGNNASCLKPDEYTEFMDKVVNREENFEKVAILYGYIVSDSSLQQEIQKLESNGDNDIDNDIDASSLPFGLKDGDHAANLLFEAAQEVSLGKVISKGNEYKINRSYGTNSRSKDIQEQLAQDGYTSALSEVLSMRLPPLFFDSSDDISEEEKKNNENIVVQKWVDDVNENLSKKISNLSSTTTTGQNGIQNSNIGKIKVFGRLTVLKKFNAEMDVTHRRVDYLLPADLLFGPTMEKEKGFTLSQFCDMLISFNRGQTTAQSNEYGLLTYLHKMKRLMQSFCTKVVELDPNSKEAMNRNKKKKKDKSSKSDEDTMKKTSSSDEEENENEDEKKSEDTQDETETETNNTKSPPPQKVNEIGNNTKKVADNTFVLRRRRFHNFTPRMMAHEFLAYRRLDRFFHRVTVRPNELFNSENMDIKLQSIESRPFIVLSLKGDMFLNGQSRALMGLFVAIVLGHIDEEIVECIFNEEYTNLVPAPTLPSFGQYAAEAWYILWEGKMKLILCPRQCEVKYGGWNTPQVLKELNDFQEEMYSTIMKTWTLCNDDASDPKNEQLKICSNWINNYLKPWSEKANEELISYRKWKEAKNLVKESHSLAIATALLPTIESSTSSSIPKLYEKVLDCLREIDSSNTWPTTTPKRQLVMVSTGEGSDGYESLALSHMKAQSSTSTDRESAYSFKEGEGGASGSFSVGAMPGCGCEPPKGNKLFPELMKAAFELEIALCPDREPSSTIAVNRNAQFRPHVDNGAGAGQSRSLIVGLGTYNGGELMVEGKKHDIRYKPLEFNGWVERHWTLPFRGERFSLVWFTPKGCEGVYGIDLCK